MLLGNHAVAESSLHANLKMCNELRDGIPA